VLTLDWILHRFHQARQLQQKLEAQDDRRFIILPSHPHKRAWDMVIIFLVLYNAIVLPLDVGFDVQNGLGWYVSCGPLHAFSTCVPVKKVM